MANKQTTSFKTTTNLQTGQTKSFKTTYQTSTPTNIGKGGLSSVGRIQMIAISMIVISMGAAVIQFDESDLILITPNYNLNNQYVPIVDPLNNVDYQQYGEGVVDSLIGFVEFLAPFGEFAQAGWTFFFQLVDADSVDFIGPDTTFGNTFGGNRVLALAKMRFSSLKAYYDELTPDERQWVLDNVDETHYGALELGFYETRWYLFIIIDFIPYFFYTEQSVYDYVVDLGIGT
jgi:hypothetical protein